MPSLTREQVRELDRLAIDHYGIPGVVLMENAGRACASEALDMLGSPAGRRVVVLAGKGNNGGDGFVIARHLCNARVRVEILLTTPPEKILEEAGESATNLEVALNMGIPVHVVAGREELDEALARGPAPDLLVDALLGTGISGEVRPPLDALIEAVGELDAPVLAVDIPSGLDADRGVPLGRAVRASRTVSFVLRKRGFEAPGAAEYTGEVVVAEIGIPRTLIEQKLLEWGLTPSP
jgi:NAD(P)H-hydrate epimerase